MSAIAASKSNPPLTEGEKKALGAEVADAKAGVKQEKADQRSAAKAAVGLLKGAMSKPGKAQGLQDERAKLGRGPGRPKGSKGAKTKQEVEKEVEDFDEFDAPTLVLGELSQELESEEPESEEERKVTARKGEGNGKAKAAAAKAKAVAAKAVAAKVKAVAAKKKAKVEPQATSSSSKAKAKARAMGEGDGKKSLVDRLKAAAKSPAPKVGVAKKIQKRKGIFRLMRTRQQRIWGRKPNDKQKVPAPLPSPVETPPGVSGTRKVRKTQTKKSEEEKQAFREKQQEAAAKKEAADAERQRRWDKVEYEGVHVNAKARSRPANGRLLPFLFPSAQSPHRTLRQGAIPAGDHSMRDAMHSFLARTKKELEENESMAPKEAWKKAREMQLGSEF